MNPTFWRRWHRWIAFAQAFATVAAQAGAAPVDKVTLQCGDPDSRDSAAASGDGGIPVA